MTINTDELWFRIKSNEGEVITTITGKKLKYRVEKEIVFWEPLEPSQNSLWKQSKKQIMLCIDARQKGRRPSEWPGTARSYKWALLNDESIWPRSHKDSI